MGAPVHGKGTYISVATKDISEWVTTSSYEDVADVHDYTGYSASQSRKRKTGGLIDGKMTCGGWYDITASTGTRGALNGKQGTTVAVIRRVEGTGTGKPQDAFNAVLSKYNESNPVDDIVRWSAEFEIDGAITVTAQP